MLLYLFSCGPQVPPGVELLDAEDRAVVLSRHPEALTEIVVPESNRPHQRKAPRSWPIHSLSEHRDMGAVTEWRGPLPSRHDFHGAYKRLRPPDMRVTQQGKSWTYQPKDGSGARTWAYDNGTLIIRVAKGTPFPDDLRIWFPWGTEAEKSLNYALAGISEKEDFIIRDEPVGDVTRHGLYLPAPSSVRAYVSLPPDGRFQTAASILRPGAVLAAASTGAVLEVVVNDSVIQTLEIDGPAPSPVDVSLADWAGKTICLELRTKAGESPYLDYVFLAEPTIRAAHKPRRALLVFVDTLRQDHLGVYGYPRDTTPNIDAWARGGRVFENAWSVAPWTMPSARAAVSGREPERWRAGPHLGEWLGKQGFTTVAVVGNKWMSEAFDFSDGWSVFDYEPRSIRHRVNRVKRWLSENEDRDIAILLHVMEPHMPYREPAPHQLFAGEAPARLPGSVDAQSVRTAWKGATASEQSEIRDYVIDRYDQNIHYTDASLAPLLTLFENDAVIFFSDHGEEFWEHGDVEHGHSLTEEQLRIPLIVRAPGLEPGRSTVPATLTDIAPTLLDLFDLPAPNDLDGISLLAAPPDRPTAFGWTLFGDEGWGARIGTRKWVTRSGRQTLFDLSTDPTEDVDLNADGDMDTRAFRDVLAQVRGRPVVDAWRVVGPGPGYWNLEPKDITIEVHHPGHFTAGWTMWDPRARQRAPVIADGEYLRMTPEPSLASPREFFGLVEDAGAGTPSLRIRHLGTWYDGVTINGTLTAGPPGLEVRVTPHVLPAPTELETYEITEDVAAELEALGYVER